MERRSRTKLEYQASCSGGEIADEIRMALATMRRRIAEMRATRACTLTRYEADAGYAPKPAPGRKAKKAA